MTQEVAWTRSFKQFKGYKVEKKLVTLDFGKSFEAPVELTCEEGVQLSILIPLVMETFLDPAKLMQV